ncbi:MAG: DUF1840 domain-containing protein [Pseudomonadota bacterium]
MLITFTSKATADVLMYENHARPILELLHKDLKRGVITAAETAAAIDVLEAEIERSKNEPNTGPDTKLDMEPSANAGMSASELSADEREDQQLQSVRFSTRAYPILEMLRAAQRAGKDVMWGV